MEKISLQHVQDLIHQVEEVLGLLKVLCDHPFHHVAAALSKVIYFTHLLIAKFYCFILAMTQQSCYHFVFKQNRTLYFKA